MAFRLAVTHDFKLLLPLVLATTDSRDGVAVGIMFVLGASQHPDQPSLESPGPHPVRRYLSGLFEHSSGTIVLTPLTSLHRPLNDRATHSL